MSKVLYYTPYFFPELEEKPEYKLAYFCGILVPCFRFGFPNSFDLGQLKLVVCGSDGQLSVTVI